MGKGYPSVFSLGLCALLLLHTCQANFLSHQTTQRDASPSNYWECYFGVGSGCGGGTNELSPQTRDEVANILKGVIENLSKHKGFVQLSESGLLKQAKGPQTKKAMLGLLVAFRNNKDAGLRIVSKLIGKPKASLSAISIAAEPSQVLAPAPPVKSAGKPAPKGPIVKK